jgi:glycolate dehydrogenase iron-sulfur subunit
MQTSFSTAQLADPDTAHSEKVLRRCVHCGFCTATCPTYVLLGDELDSPRGRIALIKNMLQEGGAPSAETVKHIDRCLSCLSCVTTCPSGVDYMRLIDHARRFVEEQYRRPFGERALRRLLAEVLTRPARLRLALRLARLARPFARLMPPRLKPFFALAPAAVAAPSPSDRPQIFPAEGPRRMRAALLPGCAQRVLKPSINEATIRLLTRHGCEVVVPRGTQCCGSLVHHLGQEEEALGYARANIDAFEQEREEKGLDAIVVNASGCGTTVKDYGFMLRSDPAYAEKAARVSSLARDVSEVIGALGLSAPSRKGPALRVAYHSPCSLQHGQRLHKEPKKLLEAAGFLAIEVPEGHLCCGSAGTYNLLQPEIALRLRERKLAHIAALEPDLVAAANIGCIVQLEGGSPAPVVHPVELLDWATGGPTPPALAGKEGRNPRAGC